MPSNRHIHECAHPLCDNFMVCSRRDGCDRPWTCPSCLDDEQANDLTQQDTERQQSPSHQQEPTQ